MVYAHVFRDGNGRVVTLFLEEAVTATETQFFMSTETYPHTQRNSGGGGAIRRVYQASIAIRGIK